MQVSAIWLCVWLPLLYRHRLVGFREFLPLPFFYVPLFPPVLLSQGPDMSLRLFRLVFPFLYPAALLRSLSFSLLPFLLWFVYFCRVLLGSVRRCRSLYNDRLLLLLALCTVWIRPMFLRARILLYARAF